MSKSIFKLGNTHFFKDVEFTGGDAVRNFVFEEEYVHILIGVIGIDHDPIFDFVQDIINEDKVREPLYRKLFQKNQLCHLKDHAI